MRLSPDPTPAGLKAFVACLLAFTILIMPIAAVAAPSIARATLARTDKTDKTNKTNKTDKKSAAEDVFVNPPIAPATETSAALPGPKPEPAPEPLAPPIVGSVTATKTAALTATANNGDGKADPGDTINYTVTLSNTSGSDATGLSFNDLFDSHTTFVPGSIKSTPICFDQTGINAVSTNEDVAKAITLTGQDPDGDSITFSIVTPPVNGGFGATTAPNLTYTPNANFFGSDSFTFRVNDGTTSGAGNNGNSNETCTVSITVNGVNDAPTFTVPGNPAAVNEDAGAQSVASFITGVRPAQVGNTTEDTQTVSFVITNNTNPTLFSSAPALNVVGGAYPKTATLTYTPAANQNGTATITYHAHDDGGTANSGVDNSADQTFTITVNAVNDPPVVVAPAAFAVQANMKRTGLTGLLGNVNDNADNGVNGCVSTTFTVTSGSISATSPAGGVVSNVNLTNGTFDFDPPPGFTGGNVTFTYTVSDTGCPGVGISAPVTVTVAVSGTVIWFVNPAAGVNGTGTLASPFNLLASANTAMGVNAGQRIFVYTGTTTSGVGVTLTTSQWLIGQGAIGTDFDTLMGITPPANTIARPTISTAGTSAANRPTIQGKVAMNGSNTKVLGINITPPANTQGLTATNGSAPGVGVALTGLQLGASPTSDVIVSTTGASGSNAMGVSLTNAGGNFNFISVTTNGGLGISADTIGSGSTMNFGPVSISNRSGTGVFINNAQGTITFGATTIPNPADAGGYGIRIDNSSATVTIPTATISDPHTVTAQTDGNTDLIPDNDGDGDAIFLKNNTGSFTLSGGTLSNCGNDCIDGRTVQTITLTNVTINTPGQETGGQGAGGHGISFIDLSGTSNLTGLLITQFLRSQVDGFRTINTNKNATVNVINCRFENTAAAGASDGNDGLFFEGRGTSNMTTVVDEASPDATHFSRFQGLFGDGIQISTGAVSTGKMTTTVKNTDFKDAYQGLTQTGSGNNGLRIAGVGGGKHAVDIQNNVFLNVNKPLFAQGVISLFINDNSEAKGTIAGNTITNATQAGIQVFADNAAGQTITDMDLIIQNNTMDNISSQGIIVQMTVTGGTLAGCDFRILNNNIGQTTPVGDGEVMFGFPGGFTSSAEGILFSTRGTAKTCNLKVANNNVKINANGVNAAFPPSNEVLQLSVSESATLNATVQNNQLLQLDDIANGAAFFGQSFGAGTPNVCLDFTGNTGNTNIDFFLQKAAGGSFVIENVANVVAANTGVWSPANPSASGYANSAGCTEPPVGITRLWVPDRGQRDYLAARPETALQTSRAESLGAFLNIKTDFASIFGSFPRSFHSDTQSAPTVLPAGNPQPAPNSASEKSTDVRTRFTQASAAFDMARADLNPARVEHASSSNTKAQPQSAIAPSSLHATVNDVRVAKASSEREVRNQRSAVRGQKSDVRSNHAQSVKTGVRGQGSGVRHNSSMASRAFAPMPVGGTFPINGTGAGFSLPNNKTITIKFSVTLNNPPNLSGVPPATPQVSNQGTLSGGFVGLPNPLLTDDPSVGTNVPPEADPTVTLVDLFNTTTTLGAVPAAGSWNVGQSVTFTATVASNPPGNPTAVTGSVIFKDNGTPIAGCNGVALSLAQAQCVTTFGSGAHSVTAVYSGDGNFDPSTSSALTQGAVSASGTTTAVTSSLNPSLVTQNVTFTATVTSTSGFAGPPTGTITFKDGVNPITCSNVGGQALNGSGVATCQIATLPAGSHSITAVYPGDTNFTTSTGTLTGDPQVVNKSDTTTLLTSSSNPVAPTVQVTYTATVSSSTSVTGPPSGTVTFKDGVTTIVCEAGSQALTAGVATCKFTYPDTVGSPHDITAVYGGDGTFNGNTSNHVSEAIQTCSASVVVTSNADSGANTLRDAIDTGVCEGGTITFDPSVTSITLATELTIAKNMTITGPGSGTLTISGNNVSRVFNVALGKTATISGMTITGGKVLGTAGAAGSGAAGGTASGGGILNAGTLTLTNVILSGNQATGGAGGSATGSAGGVGGGAFGGAIFNSGTLTLNNSTVNGSNSATGGKGGDSDTTNGNGGSAFGGGIYNSGTLTLTNSTISGNTTAGGAAGSGAGAAGTAGAGSGGGVYHDATASPATLTVTGSTISGNTSSTNGGGIANVGTLTNATLTITNTTISGNGANNDGGGIYNAGATGTTTLTSVTVTGNTTDKDDLGGGAGGGLNIVSGTFTLKNTIVAGNLKGTTTPTAHDITGTVNTAGSASSYNLIGDAASSGGLTDGTDHNIVGNAGLGTIDIATVLNTTLADNGGPTKTHALVNGSPALEKGNAFGLTTDQRGFPRPVNFDATPPVAPFDDTDIGAFESQIAPAAPGAPNAPDLDAASDSGASNTDNYTNDATPTFTINGVINGANVELLRDGTSVANGTAVGTSIQLTDPGATAGLHTYRARQTVGITLSPDSGPLDVTIDTSIAQPSTPDLITADDSNINNDNVTSKTTPTFTGTAEANSAVQLFATGVLKGSTTADGSGNWSITSSALADGPYNITAVATDAAGNISIASAALPIIIDTAKPTVAMSSATGNPTATTPIPVTVTFNEPVTGFVIGDIVTANGTTGNFAGGPAVYTFDLTPTSPGAVSADIAAGVAIDLAGNTNTAATQFNRTFDPSALSVTITPVAPDPRNTSVSSIQIVFNKAVTGFDLPDLTLKLNGGANLLTGAQTLTSGDNITWTLGSLSGLTGAQGTYVLKLTASGSNIKDAANNLLTSDASETWVTDTTAPDVTINQAAGQADPVTGTSATTIINFTAIFSEPVVAGSFTNSDVTISGTAGATVVNISEIAPFDGTHFNVAIGGMTQSGTVIADIAAGVAQDAAGNGNTVGTFTDHTVTFNKNDFTALEVNTVADTDDGFCTALGSGPGANQDCTLREAINAANGDAGAETITFNTTVFPIPGPHVINLLTALLDISTDMTIQGPGANVLTVKRNVATRFRIFTVTSGVTVNISGLLITNGFTSDGSSGVVGGVGDAGGGILNSGTLTLTGVAVIGNKTGKGGDGTLGTGGWGGSGGGILNGGTLTINNSTISGNQTGNGGNSGNGLGGFGGGVESGGALTVTNSTISGNHTGNGGIGGIGSNGGDGGGIDINGSPTTAIGNSTITGNSTGTGTGAGHGGNGGGIRAGFGTNTIKSSIIGGNFVASGGSGPDISLTVNSEGYNLIQSTSGATITETLNPGTNITGQDPLLFPLADNGGPTFTHALQCTSPAIDKGFSFGLTTDQRGGVRPFDLADAIYPNAAGGDGSDIGAYETQSGGGCLPLAVPPAPPPSTNEDTQVTITLTGTYSQNFPLTFTITQQPAHATATLVPTAPVCVFALSMTCTSTVSYTPSLNFNGLDSFKFKVSAGGLDSDEADVNVTVIPVNDPPVAIPQGVFTDEDTPLNILLTGSDVDSASLNFIIVTPPAHGSLNPGGAGQNQTYTPAANYNGPDSFTFKINDGSADSNTATVSITVNAVNDAPVANAQSVSTNEDTPLPITLTGSDIDSSTLTFSIVTPPAHGSFGATTAPNLTYTPDANYNGPDSFTFKINDGSADSNTATVSITVNPVNDAPTANSQSVSTNEDTPLPITLTGSDVETASGSLTFTITVSPSHGVLSGSGANRTYTPAADYNGPDSFKFTVTDTGDGASPALTSAEATVSITVNAVNDVPSFTKGPDQSATSAVAQTVPNWATNISAGPPDEAAQTLTFLVSNNNNAIFSVQPSISPSGTLTYTPAYGFDGVATVTVRLMDNGGTALGGVDTSAAQTFTITVHALNNAPTLDALSNLNLNEDAPLQTVNLAGITAGPSFESSQSLTITATSNNTALIPNPSVTYTSPNTTGSISFTPLPDANGSALITVTVKDDGGTLNGGVDTFVRTFTVTVGAVNDAPVNHVPGPQNIPLNASFVFSTGTGNAIFITDVDAGSDPVQVTLKATDGTLTLNGTSGLSFSVGDGTDDPLMTFTGSIASINAALEGMKNLVFGSGVITITTNDLGHNGIGGPLSDTDTIQVTVNDNLAPVLLTIPGTDRAIAFDSVTFVVDPFSLVGSNNFTADHRTHITLFALHAQLRPGETASAITAEADVDGTIVPLIVESVMTVPNFDWLTQIVVKFPDGFSTGGGGPHDAKIRIRLRGQDSNQAVIIIVPAPRP
jgi:CSLREA domain-containing protein